MVAARVELMKEWLLPESTRISTSLSARNPENCIVCGAEEPFMAATDIAKKA
jgi:hypothetical protein